MSLEKKGLCEEFVGEEEDGKDEKDERGEGRVVKVEKEMKGHRKR